MPGKNRDKRGADPPSGGPRNQQEERGVEGLDGEEERLSARGNFVPEHKAEEGYYYASPPGEASEEELEPRATREGLQTGANTSNLPLGRRTESASRGGQASRRGAQGFEEDLE
jgi:hypothetical protein